MGILDEYLFTDWNDELKLLKDLRINRRAMTDMKIPTDTCYPNSLISCWSQDLSQEILGSRMRVIYVVIFASFMAGTVFGYYLKSWRLEFLKKKKDRLEKKLRQVDTQIENEMTSTKIVNVNIRRRTPFDGGF